MHGARGGAPKGKANGRYRTGIYTAELVKARRFVTAMCRLMRHTDDLED